VHGREGACVTEPIQHVKTEFFKAMAHPARIRMLELLSDGELSVGELTDAVGLEGSHVSQQLGVLRRADLVRSRKEGTTVIYSLADRRIAEVLQLSKEILLSNLAEKVSSLSEHHL
jgi:ArsR family transcriptional regulator